MIIWQVLERDIDKDGNIVANNAPWDPDHYALLCAYDQIAELAPQLASVGITHVMLPNPIKTISGHYATGDGYGVTGDRDLCTKMFAGHMENRFGGNFELRRCIAILHANGIKTMIDRVMLEIFGPDTYIGSDKKTAGVFPKDSGCYWGVPPANRPQDPIPNPYEGNYHFSNKIFVNKNSAPAGYVGEGLQEETTWIWKCLGITGGARLDDVKATWTGTIDQNVNYGPMQGQVFVGEYAAGTQEIEWWIQDLMWGRCHAFDFDKHYTMQRIADQGAPMSRFDSDKSLTSVDPMHAVTFVESPDSDVNGYQNIKSFKRGLYAALFGMEGVPCIYGKDALTYGLLPSILNGAWVNTMFAAGHTATVAKDTQYGNWQAWMRTGDPTSAFANRRDGLVFGVNKGSDPAHFYCQTPFGPNRHIHDYSGLCPDATTDANGAFWAMLPANENGRAASYFFYAPSEYQNLGSVHLAPMETTQHFIGANNLDRLPLKAGKQTIDDIWCEAGTTVKVKAKKTPALSELEFALVHSDAPAVLMAAQANTWSATAVARGRYSIVCNWRTTGTAAADYDIAVTYTGTTTLWNVEATEWETLGTSGHPEATPVHEFMQGLLRERLERRNP